MKDICDSYVHAYKIDNQQELLDTIETLKNYCKEPIVDKYIDDWTDETGFHPGYRGYEKLKDIATIFEDTLNANKDKSNAEIAKTLRELVIQRLNDCKNFYRFDREEGDFKASVALGASPTSNPETVRKYWKEKGVELEFVEKDPDTLWERDYYGDAYDDYLKECENEVIDEE